MNMGKGYVVTIPNKENETKLMKLFEKRKENYPIISRLPFGNIYLISKSYPIKYLVSSLDGNLLRLDDLKELDGLECIFREAKQEDISGLNH